MIRWEEMQDINKRILINNNIKMVLEDKNNIKM